MDDVLLRCIQMKTRTHLRNVRARGIKMRNLRGHGDRRRPYSLSQGTYTERGNTNQ